MVPPSCQIVRCLQHLFSCKVRILGVTLRWGFWTPNPTRVHRPWSYRRLCSCCASRNGTIVSPETSHGHLMVKLEEERLRILIFSSKQVSGLKSIISYYKSQSHPHRSDLTCAPKRLTPCTFSSQLTGSLVPAWEMQNVGVFSSENLTTCCFLHIPGTWKNATPNPTWPE